MFCGCMLMFLRMFSDALNVFADVFGVLVDVLGGVWRCFEGVL